jgi:transcriptional regulator with XRE-family HTH domain
MGDTDRHARERFAANIEEWRRRRALTVEELADRAQIDDDELASILRGDAEAGAGAIYMIAGALEVDPGELFRGVGWAPPVRGGDGYVIDDPGDD